MPELPTVLVVDDKHNMVSLLQKVLRQDAHVITATSGAQALERLREHPQTRVVVTDIRMPGIDGIDVMRAAKATLGGVEVILMTAHASLESAIDAIRLGAFDYLRKPFTPEQARSVVLRALGRARSPSSFPAGPVVLPGVSSVSKAMQHLAAEAEKFAQSDVTVLILGETGTGKKRIARAIHELSARQAGPLVAFNCAAIPNELLESELFGYSHNAFSGATSERAGLFEEASSGSLFLDEIGEMPMPLQAKLTRALEEKAVRRLGESRERSVDTRFIAATHRDLAALVKSGAFREDLWYRLNVGVLHVPPLRERPDDITLLANEFLHERVGDSKRFSPQTLSVLESYPWPGNVRQLRAAVERAVALSEGDIVEVTSLPHEVIETSDSTRDPAQLSWTQAQKLAQEQSARDYLQSVLRLHNGQVAKAAAHAGVERESFYRLLRRYGVSLDSGR